MLAELIGKQLNSRLPAAVQFAAREERTQSCKAHVRQGRWGSWLPRALLWLPRCSCVGSLDVHALCAGFGRCYVRQSSCDRVCCDGMRVAMRCRARRACLLILLVRRSSGEERGWWRKVFRREPGCHVTPRTPIQRYGARRRAIETAR